MKNTRAVSLVLFLLVPCIAAAQTPDPAAKVDEINLVASVSETHNRANMGMTPAASIEGFARIMETVRGSGLSVNATVTAGLCGRLTGGRSHRPSP